MTDLGLILFCAAQCLLLALIAVIRMQRLDGEHRPTLRDYFAAKAMAGSLAGEPGSHLVPHTLARDAYVHADAMLKARSA